MAASLMCIVAIELNSGIGYRGALPWPRLKSDLQFLKKKSVTTMQKGKSNAVVMGRLTWESIPATRRPLSDRYNVVLSSKSKEELPGAHLVCPSLEAAMAAFQTPPLTDNIESIYVLGGGRVYEEAMCSCWCRRLYVTRILGDFTCDAFFPAINADLYVLNQDHKDELLPDGTLEENGVKFKFEVYDRIQ